MNVRSASLLRASQLSLQQSHDLLWEHLPLCMLMQRHECTRKHILCNRCADIRRSFSAKPPRASSLAKIIAALVTGCACFVTYQVWALHGKLRVVNDVHRAERKVKFIYPAEPLMGINYEAFPDIDKEEVKRKVKKNVRKVLPSLQSFTTDPDILLKLAESCDPDIRSLGLKRLVRDNHWHDYEYRKVAQGSSQRTQVSLARFKEADERLFRSMPWVPPTLKDSLEDELRDLLTKLQTDITDDSVQQITARILTNGKQKDIIEIGQRCYSETPLEYVKYETEDNKDSLVMALMMEALAAHSQLPEQRVKIVENNGLQLLQRVYLQCDRKIDCSPMIARVLANLALDTDLRKPIIDGGWVGVLHQWLSHSNSPVFFPAASALLNLDQDLESTLKINAVYEDEVYPAYPVHRSRDKKLKVNVDIVFIHGLLGGPFKTWRQDDRMRTKLTDDDDPYTYFWPKDWLAEDVKNVRVLSVGFDTELTTWNLRHPIKAEKRTLSSRSQVLIEKLKKADIGSRPVVWVGHSMGGLLIKEMLRMASTDRRYSGILDKTIGVLFYSVPHHGASLANMSNRAKYMLFPSTEVQELDSKSVKLRELHRSFQHLVARYHIPVMSIGELEKTAIGLKLKTHIVPTISADPGVGEFRTVQADHINVCKPRTRNSDIYTITLFFIRRCIIVGLIRDKLGLKDL